MAAGYQATDTMIQLSLEVQVESRVVSLLKLLRDMLKSWDLEDVSGGKASEGDSLIHLSIRPSHVKLRYATRRSVLLYLYVLSCFKDKCASK